MNRLSGATVRAATTRMVIRFVAAEKIKGKEIIATALGIRLVMSLIVCLLILFLRSAICRFFHSDVLVDFIIFIPIIFFLQYLFISLQSFLLVDRRLTGQF